MHKTLRSLFAVTLVVPALASATDVAKIEIYAAGVLQQSVSFQGPNSSVRVSRPAVPNTTLDLRLVAPEPLILEVTETTSDNGGIKVVGRVKLLMPGDSLAISDIKGGSFHSPYVFVRTE